MCDLVTERRDWNLQMLKHWIHLCILDKMSNIQLPNGDLEPDKFMLEGVACEVGSVKQLYGVMMHVGNINVDHEWKRIWRLRVP